MNVRGSVRCVIRGIDSLDPCIGYEEDFGFREMGSKLKFKATSITR